MGYLNNRTNEIIVDAVLTKKGREILASAGKLDITKFALSDDEVDYGLYNTDNPNGSDYFDIAIRKLPILEAIPSTNIPQLRYKLFTVTTSPTQITQTYSVTVQGVPTAPIRDYTSIFINPQITPIPSTGLSNVKYKLTVSPNTGTVPAYELITIIADNNANIISEKKQFSNGSSILTIQGKTFKIVPIKYYSSAQTFTYTVESEGVASVPYTGTFTYGPMLSSYVPPENLQLRQPI